MKPHKHSKEIKAWADGAQIQVIGEITGRWIDDDDPEWDDDVEYRIKPTAYAVAGATSSTYGCGRQPTLATIDIDDHMSAIEIYRDSKQEAEAIRDKIIDMLNAAREGK